MMRNGKEEMFQFLCLVVACSLIGLSGCRESSDIPEGAPLSNVLLRYKAQVGQTRSYRASMNLDKKIFSKGQWRSEGNERGKVTFSMTTVEQTAAGYRTTFDGQWGDSSFSAETKDVMNDKVEAVRGLDVIVSDRYVWDKGGTHNLCFPDEPVSPGDQWEGAALFTFGDMATVNEPTLQMSYRLVKAVENEAGKYALIECRPLTDKVEVPLQIGQLGLKCDATGTVTAVREDCDAQDKINVGDELLAVNGHPAATAKDWHILYERFIEMPNDVGDPVVLTVRREGQEQEIEVRKSFATLGTMEIILSEAARTVVFDIDKGSIISDKDSPVYSVTYRFLDAFPFVDNYMGTGSFKNRAGTEIGPRVYHNQNKMTLLP